jgi:hypothetical protein
MKAKGFSNRASTSIFDDFRILASVYGKIIFEHCQWEANEVARESY